MPGNYFLFGASSFRIHICASCNCDSNSSWIKPLEATKLRVVSCHGFPQTSVLQPLGWSKLQQQDPIHSNLNCDIQNNMIGNITYAFRQPGKFACSSTKGVEANCTRWMKWLKIYLFRSNQWVDHMKPMKASQLRFQAFASFALLRITGSLRANMLPKILDLEVILYITRMTEVCLFGSILFFVHSRKLLSPSKH